MMLGKPSKRHAIVIAAGLAVAVAMAVPWRGAAAQPPVTRPTSPPLVPQTPGSPSPGNSMVAIVYGEPGNPAHEAIRDRLRKRQVLEQLQAFLAPLRLPRTLTVALETCKRANAFYSKSKVTVCYEFVELTRTRAPVATTAEGVTPEDAIVAGFVSVVLHEVSHAVFDMLQIPVFGREEDAADQLAAFVMLQFGTGVARRLIAAKAHLWDSAGSKRRPRGKRDYADTHGTEYQRFYNILCIAYGHDPKTFADYVQSNILPPARAARCRSEYAKVLRAFRTLILPHIDRETMEQVRRVEWLRPSDGKL